VAIARCWSPARIVEADSLLGGHSSLLVGSPDVPSAARTVNPPGESGDEASDTLNLQLVHYFPHPSAVTLACMAVASQGTQYTNLKIIAVQASDTSNVFLGGQ
jgi:hypothetical protein